MSKQSGEKLLLTTPRFRVVEALQPTAGAPRPRQIIRHPGSVVILPLLDDRQVCLIRNYRISVGKTLVELPAGTIENDDDPLETAVRELQEETGFRAAQWRELPGCFMSPGILEERTFFFAASNLTPGPPAREAGEEIENFVVPLSDAMAMTLDGRIEDAKTIVGLLLWEKMQLHPS